MIDSPGPRIAAMSAAAAAASHVQSDGKIVHRPPTKVLPVERVDHTAPTGPRPAFQHTYLEQVAALWPDEPDPPVTQVDYEAPEDAPSPPPEQRGSAKEALAALRKEPAPDPTLDIRR